MNFLMTVDKIDALLMEMITLRSVIILALVCSYALIFSQILLCTYVQFTYVWRELYYNLKGLL